MRFFPFVLVLFLSFETLFGEAMVEYDYELDAYYSNVSAFIDLDPDKEITNAIDMSERDIYTSLFLNTFSPNIILFEASLNPMGIFGLYFRSENEDLYTKTNIQDTNLIKSVTAGFEEPYAFSFFIGRMMVFKNSEDDRVGKNRAYMGYLISVGDSTIKDNVAYTNKWVNVEYKLKGTRTRDDVDLDWSFRVGAKFNENDNFTDTLYIGARRSSINYKESRWSLVKNSAFSTMLAVSAKTFEFTEGELMVEKKWPISWSDKVSFGLGIGYLYYSTEKYSGALRDEGIDNHQLIFRPNLKW